MASLDEFTYSPLGPSEIRLIKILPGRDSDLIRCTLENVSWDNNPEYETLSYVWGPDQLYASIILNGRPFLVRRNLWFALYHLRGNRETKTRTLREDEAIPSAMSPENDLVTQVTNSKAKFKSAVSRGKAKLGSSSERSEEMSSLESDMGSISVRQQRLADKSKSSSGRLVWIDAICINQDDILERNVQVQMMDIVYEKAKCVLIWLGEDPSNDRAALKYFKHLNDLPKPTHLSISLSGSGEYVTGLSTDLTTYGENYEIDIEDSEQPSEEAKQKRLNNVNWDAILEICHRSFWERLWVIQEVVLSQRRLVLYGNDILPWEYFERVVQTMVMDKGMASMSVWVLSREIHDRLMQSPAIKFFQGLKNIDYAGKTGRCSLRSLVTSFHGSMTTDPKDQIYGFLGIAAPAKGVIADYTKTAAELYIDVLKASIWSSNYTDHYLVHFSELLQRALGDPFWNNDKKSFFHIGHDLSIKKGTNQALLVRAILGKRIKWDSKSHMAPPRKALNEMYLRSELERMLDKKGFKGGRTFQQITAFDKEANNSVFLQRFRIHKYFSSELTEGGSALLSQMPNPDDYLCFFKDCNIAAVVRLKPGSSNIYVVVGRALVDQSSDFYDWTMECNVELTLQSLQLLTR